MHNFFHSDSYIRGPVWIQLLANEMGSSLYTICSIVRVGQSTYNNQHIEGGAVLCRQLKNGLILTPTKYQCFDKLKGDTTQFKPDYYKASTKQKPFI